MTRSDFFNIDTNTGRITLARTISSDDPNTFTLPVYATDDGSCCTDHGVRHTSEQNVTINIVNSVNTKPVFNDCTQYYSSAVQENQGIGTSVAQVIVFLGVTPAFGILFE